MLFEPHCRSDKFNKQPVLYSSTPLEIMSLKILPSSFRWMLGIYSGICNWICYQSPQQRTHVIVTTLILCLTIHVAIGCRIDLSMLTCCCYWYRFELSTKEWSGHPSKLAWALNRLSYVYAPIFENNGLPSFYFFSKPPCFWLGYGVDGSVIVSTWGGIIG